MPVKLIPTKTVWTEIEDAEFQITYATPAELSEIYNRHTDRGQVDTMAATMDILKKYVHNWMGIKDEEGNDVSFNPELLGRLPLRIQNELVNEITKYVIEAEEIEKNS